MRSTAGQEAGPEGSGIGDGRAVAVAVARGVCRHFEALDQACLVEFTLRTGRRVDLIALARDGSVTVVEVKSTPADYRSDGKWREYLDFCDRFYFAVPEGFPIDILPAECGLLVADAFAAAELREPAPGAMNGHRRRALILRFARAAAARLMRASGPSAALQQGPHQPANPLRETRARR